MQGKKLRSGFTTGTCGAAAAKAAAVRLLTGETVNKITIMTPKGVAADLDVECMQEGSDISFRVRKDAGDDPDVTHGAWIHACVVPVPGEAERFWYRSEDFPHLYLTGKTGIGLVTKPGLSCPVGKHAINPVPRRMIFEAVEEACEMFECKAPLLIQIAVPEGAALAEKTFNPKLGIKGGISILGTSGIVEPMSDQALLATIRLEIHMNAAEGREALIITPGNYGERFLREELHLPLEQAVRCSNFIADTMDMAASEGIREILLVGHVGKLIKAAGGVPNTHSQYGDRRMEILASCLDIKDEEQNQTEDEGKKGTDELLRLRILGSNTTEEALEHLTKAGLRRPVMKEALRRICRYLRLWSHEKVHAEAVMFSNVYGILAKSSGADEMIKKLTAEET